MLVAAVSRFLTRLSTMSAFRSAGLSLAEWCALSIIAGGEDVNSRQLAKTLGVSAQRINQTTASLRRSGFISVARAADDARKKVITITPNGSARLKQVDGELRRVIHSELPGKSRLFVRTRRLIVGKLMRAVLPAKGVTRG